MSHICDQATSTKHSVESTCLKFPKPVPKLVRSCVSMSVNLVLLENINFLFLDPMRL